MTVYLVRHAHAVAGADDAARRLSRRGRKQIRQMGRFLKANGALAATEFWHSPLVRARTTAQLLGQRLKRRTKFIEVSGLLHSDNPAVMAKRLGRVRRSVAVVGHEPHLGALLSLLVTGSARPVRFELKKCAIAALARSSNRWILQWQLSPGLVKRR